MCVLCCRGTIAVENEGNCYRVLCDAIQSHYHHHSDKVRYYMLHSILCDGYLFSYKKKKKKKKKPL